ncbi:MAG: hypothetical protein FWC32_08410 [Firmicutes bacterium]|nr:hypothetical protein [Bacillota bacterium]
MQNRKKVNQEIERKKRNKRRLSTFITVLALAALLAAIVWIAWDVRSRGWIVNFEGQRISTSEINLFAALWQQDPGDPAIREAIAHTIVEAEIILARAERAGLGMTADEREDMLNLAQELRELWGIPRNISNDRIAEVLGVWEFLYARVFDHYAIYTPNREEFAEELEEYVLLTRADYELRNTEAQFIVSDNFAALEAVSELGGGDNFEEAAREYCFWYSEETGVMVAPIISIIEFYGLLDHSFELLGLQEGDTSAVIEIDEGQYLLVHMLSRPGIEDSEIEEAFLARAGEERRHEMFAELLEGWTESANYTINPRIVN